MKKVIIALLVIASLFAFVSCKDEVTYEKFAKMEFLDVESEKGIVIHNAIDFYQDYASDYFNPTSEETVYHFDKDGKSGTLVITKGIEEGEMDSYKFKGSYKLNETKTYKSFEFKYDGTDVYDAKGTTKLVVESDDYDFAWELVDPNEYKVDSIERKKVYEAENLSVSASAGETDYTISKITVKTTAKGFNEKMMCFEFRTDTEACDYEYEITYNEGPTPSTTGLKTLKATYSVVRLAGDTMKTVSFDGKTYSAETNEK